MIATLHIDNNIYAMRCMFDEICRTKYGIVKLIKGHIAVYDWRGDNCRIEVMTEQDFIEKYNHMSGINKEKLKLI